MIGKATAGATTITVGIGLETGVLEFPTVPPGVFSQDTTYPVGNICSEPGLLPGAPPAEPGLFEPIPFPLGEPVGPFITDPPQPVDRDLVPDIYEARRNAHLAGKNHPITGIPFDQDGYPDFSSVSVVDVKIGFTGSRGQDVKLANQVAGFDRTPEGYVWHHHQDGTTMQLVPRDIHMLTGHDGGFAGR